MKGQKDIVQLLLEEGADPSLWDHSGDMVLDCLCYWGTAEIQCMLQEAINIQKGNEDSDDESGDEDDGMSLGGESESMTMSEAEGEGEGSEDEEGGSEGDVFMRASDAKI